MSKKNLQEKLSQYIINADDQALHYLNEAAIKYENQKVLDKMIEEGEEDIADGKTHSLKEARKILKQW